MSHPMNHSQTPKDLPRAHSDATRDRQAQLTRVCNGLKEGGGLRMTVERGRSFFFCKSDIRQLWADSRSLGLVLPGLSPDRLDVLWSTSLLFITFCVHIEAPLVFYPRLAQLLFRHNDKTPLFQDADMPYDQTQLDQLGLPSDKSARWEEQHCFTPVTLRFNSKTLEVQTISDKLTRIPFIEVEKEFEESGAHGVVQFYKLAAEYVANEDRSRHQSSVSVQTSVAAPVAVAVKSFLSSRFSDATVNARAEVRIQSILRQGDASRQSIVLASAAIEHHDWGLLIFYPRAELGDLGHFLRGGLRDGTYKLHEESLHVFRQRSPYAQGAWGPRGDSDLARALLKQCAGLASALNFLHIGFQGPNKSWLRLVHMDLKPDNIVLFAGDLVGHWKLCDFGLSESVEDQNKGQGNETIHQLLRAKTVDVTPRRRGGQYQAPEVEAVGEARVGRSSDIWSFGCMFAEVLAFALGGPEAVKDFTSARRQQHAVHSDHTFHSRGGNQASSPRIVRPQVFQWLDQQCGRDRSPPVWACCWAGHICKILQVDRNKRPSAEELVNYVNHVLEDARTCTRELTHECEEFRYVAGPSPEQQSERQDVVSEPSSYPITIPSRMPPSTSVFVSTPELSTGVPPASRRPRDGRHVRFSESATGRGSSGPAVSYYVGKGAGSMFMQ